MTRAPVSSGSFQSLMKDDTFCDDLTTLNQNSSSSILHQSLHVEYRNQEYIIQKNSSQTTIKRLMKEDESMINNTGLTQIDSDLFSTHQKLNPRNVAIIELITSEQRFVYDMKNILKTYIKPMSEKEILSSSHIDALFLNWPCLTRTHEKLASAFVIASKAQGEFISVGRILCEFIPQLINEYEIYFRFHPIAMKCFREQLNVSSKFRRFMQKTKQQSYGIGTMGDANILTLPLQRIAKYPFMIDQILKTTSIHHHDYVELQESLAKANELRETINNAIDEEANRTKFEWLQTHVDCQKFSEIIIFNSLTRFGEQRKLLHYSQLRFYKKKSNCILYAMLFNDFLLLTRAKWPLVTKVFQVLHRTTTYYHRFEQNGYIYRPSVRQNNTDWFDLPEARHLYLSVYKKPLMLHDIQNIEVIENNSFAFQFDYHGSKMIFLTNSPNERLLWMKNINDAIDVCRRKCFVTSLLRAPKLDFDLTVGRTIGKLFIREINATNLPLISLQKNNPNPYCILEMDTRQRQTTPVLCDKSNLQWNISMKFHICDINNDVLKCSIYNRSKYTTDRLLGSVEIPLKSICKREISQEDSSSIYSSGTGPLSSISSISMKQAYNDRKDNESITNSSFDEFSPRYKTFYGPFI